MGGLLVLSLFLREGGMLRGIALGGFGRGGECGGGLGSV